MEAKRDEERVSREVLPRPDIGRQNLNDVNVTLLESFIDRLQKRILVATYRCSSKCKAKTGKRPRKDFSFIYSLGALDFRFFNIFNLWWLFEP